MVNDENLRNKIDMVIIDCDATNIVQNVERALRLVRIGGWVCIQSTLGNGRVVNETAQDPETRALRDLNRRLREDKRVDMCMLGISDGLTLCIRRE
jgi:O-methyltransferase